MNKQKHYIYTVINTSIKIVVEQAMLLLCRTYKVISKVGEKKKKKIIQGRIS